MTLYDALGIDKDATIDAVKRAYRKAAKTTHPDAGGDAETFALVCLAKDVLTDERRRKQYDELGSTDDLEAAVHQVAFDAICMATAELGSYGAPLERVNIVAEAKGLLRQQLSNISTAEMKTKRAVKDLERVRSRFKANKKKDTRLSDILEHGAERARRQYQQQRLVVEGAIAFLDEHTFDRDGSAVGRTTAGMLGGFFNT